MTFPSSDYDYLWTDCDVGYFFASCYLFPNFKRNDFVLIYNYAKKELQFYLAKKDHQRLAEEGLIFYKKQYSTWKKRILCTIERGKKLITEKDFANLERAFVERVALFQDLGNDYFYTEFFVTKLAEQDPELAQTMKEMSQIKFQARIVLTEFYNYEHVFAPILSKLSRKDLPNLSYDEIFGLIRGKDVSGRNCDWVLAKKSGWKLLTGNEAQAIKQEFSKSESNSIVGLTANKGRYRGPAKIIRTVFSDNIQKEISKVKKGDVLVANTTGPEIMTACMKAGAIVTDEGGLTSHAAIVSRELGIPCIVGTKIATKVLNDGEIVEVDANKGVVRKK